MVNIFDENAVYCSTLKIVEEAGKPRRLENKVNSKCVGRTGIFTFRASAKEKEYLYKKGNGENLHFPGYDITDGGTVNFCSEGSCKKFTYNATIDQVHIFDEEAQVCATLRILDRAGSKKLANDVDNNCVGRAGLFTFSPSSAEFEYRCGWVVDSAPGTRTFYDDLPGGWIMTVQGDRSEVEGMDKIGGFGDQWVTMTDYPLFGKGCVCLNMRGETRAGESRRRVVEIQSAEVKRISVCKEDRNLPDL